jgi:hypothetical protein
MDIGSILFLSAFAAAAMVSPFPTAVTFPLPETVETDKSIAAQVTAAVWV